MTKKVSFAILSLTFSLLILEIFSFTYLKFSNSGFSHGETVSTRYSNFLSKAFFAPSLDEIYKWLQPHPYFGYVGNVLQNKNVNNKGFNSNKNFPYKKKTNDFVIGIFGGSMASQFATFLRDNSLAENLVPRRPSYKNKNIVVLNMAMGGYKQPQQLMIFSRYSDMFDLTINIDGFNEVWINATSGIPPSYPAFSELFYMGEKTKTKFERELILNQNAFMWAAFLNDYLPWSQTAYLLWSKFLNLSSKAKEYQALALNPHHQGQVNKEAVLKGVNSWIQFSGRQRSLAVAQGVESIFFIQPNQHWNFDVSDLKKNQNRINMSIFKIISYGYGQLNSKIKSSANLNEGVYFLSDEFNSQGLSAYSDACCHLNDEGNKRLLELISNKIAIHLP